MWGVLALLLNFIPTIGIWIAMIPPIILALLEFGLTKALIVLVGYLLIDALIENVAKPKFLGEGLNLAPVTIILSLIFWAAVLGPLGALLAVPLTLAVKELVLAADEDSRWLAELMSSKRDTPEEPEPHRDEEDDQERA
jgi:predicted PurR-regulated permease PerM